MARKARQRISYVLPLQNSPGGHRLGVNSLVIDRKGILYSAGRDGVICSWNIGVKLPDKPTLNEIRSLSTFRDQFQAHTHWVNDLVFCNSNEAVVSCSSDLTVKLWKPYSSTQQAHTIGVHSDYVKCLAAPTTYCDWVASGGLDRKIKFWDLNGGGEKLQIDVGDGGSNPKGSIYSLGTGGGILASGGPESVVRVWDPRSGKRITKFVGHTDNVRSILVSEQGNTVLTASSDTTIKLWSLTAGRCLHTLSMHNDSVWSLHSSHPALEIFYSSDRSGLVAKTDVRHVAEVDDGICVAVCQENDGVNKVVACGDYLWTATSSSNINRWLDIDTDVEITADGRRPWVTPPTSTRPRMPTGHLTSPTIAISPRKAVIPFNSLLPLSSSSFPSNVRDPDAVTIYSMTSAMKASMAETLIDDDTGMIIPMNDIPDETIEGQCGLLKHFLLNDRRRVLTVDTAGEVVLWDLLKCIPTKFYGKRHLEDVAAEVNTTDSIANWCQVDTRTGMLACVLEENYCFDAEMYADEAGIEGVEFRDDQRINLGKWVLRYLFSNLIDEEIRRDEDYRKMLEKTRQDRERLRLENAVTKITIPSPILSSSDSNERGGPAVTPLAKPAAGGYTLFPLTPSMGIGLATPSSANASNVPFITTPWDDGTTGKSADRTSGDYFSTESNSNAHVNSSPKNGLLLGETASEDIPPPQPPVTPPADKEKEKDEKDSSLFAKWRPFGNKKLGRSASTDMGSKSTLPTSDEKPSEQAAIEEAIDKPDLTGETLAGVIKKIRSTYQIQVRETQGESSVSLLTPSLPQETPVLKPPRNTTIIVQEDKPDSGGVADLYRGTVGCVGEDADLLESVTPAWLGEVLLLNRIPLKDTIKISFVLIPWQDELPYLPSESGSVNEGKNARLNANRMLRAKKIMAYVAEHLQPPFMWTPHVPEVKDEEDPKYEDWLELVCHDQVVPPTMTLATMRSYVWKMSGDVVLYYRMKEQKTGELEEEASAPKGSKASSEKTVERADDGSGSGRTE